MIVAIYFLTRISIMTA